MKKLVELSQFRNPCFGLVRLIARLPSITINTCKHNHFTQP